MKSIRTIVCLLGLAALALPPARAADALQPGEYVCSETPRGLPCSPVHLFMGPGNTWKWGKRKGTWTLDGNHIRFDGERRGPVVWGKAQLEGDSIRWVDRDKSMAFRRKGDLPR